MSIKPLTTLSAQETVEGGSVISYARFYPRAHTLSSLLQIFFSFPFNYYLLRVCHIERKDIYISYSMHGE